MSSQSSPHDAVFRRVLGEPANAASELRAVLPSTLRMRLDLDQLESMPASFVDDDLSYRHSDLLFTAPLDGRDAFIYVLIEHQSATDPMMPFRMLQYVVRIWDRHVHENPATDQLPVVILLVVHHNKRPWGGPTELTDLIDIDEDLAGVLGELVPKFGFLLDDLTIMDEQALRERPVSPTVRVTLLLLKTAAGNVHLADDLQAWSDQLRAVFDSPGGAKVFQTLVKYIGLVAETPADQLRDLFAGLGPDAEEAYMTTADMLRAEGRAEGRAQGRAQTLVQQLTLKFGPLPPATVDTIHAATTDQLETWTARVLTADSIDDVLR